MRKIILMALLAVFNVSLAQERKTAFQVPKDIASIPNDMLYGIVEPLWERDGTKSKFQVTGFNLDTAVGLMELLGVRSFRMMFKEVFDNSSEFDADLIQYHKSAIKKLNQAGVNHIIGMCMIFPTNSGFSPKGIYAVPQLLDPNYQGWLIQVSNTWEKISALFPEISYWEMGNELNEDFFFYPNGYSGGFGSENGGVFTKQDKIAHILNYMFYASKGIKKGNPRAVTVMPGLSPGRKGLESNELADFMELLYEGIHSNNYPLGAIKSNKSDDYFEILAWHPYAVLGKVDQAWMQANKAIYDVAKKYGDGHKPVFFTEIGFTDYGDEPSEIHQIKLMKDVFNFIKTDLFFVKNVTAFRLFECTGALAWGGKGEIHFGYFKEPSGQIGFSPKMKAFSLQTIYGGKGDLRKFE
ncbi:hypothetical protein ACFRAE_08445 [Sphingobacterium sp. HJSM2_6]|uniref:hypothetical protein n=1 Tax=Sphingobacterium sp. HJSM2_6 TaxID=3366264 RepID=UPI003BBB8D97